MRMMAPMLQTVVIGRDRLQQQWNRQVITTTAGEEEENEDDGPNAVDRGHRVRQAATTVEQTGYNNNSRCRRKRMRMMAATTVEQTGYNNNSR